MDLFNKKKVKFLEEQLRKTEHNCLLRMSDKECDDYYKFFHKHFEKHLKEKYGSKKEGYKYKNPLPGWCERVELYHTGIGTAIKVICPICEEVKDITDVESW